MSPQKEVVVERGGESPAEVLKAYVEAQMAAAFERKEATPELTEVPYLLPFFDWEIIAFGPWQTAGPPQTPPGRIIELGETAYLATVVLMNPAMCTNILGFQGKIQLSYWTSNTQTMRPVPAMNYTCCLEIRDCVPAFAPFVVHIWEFVPTEAACTLETNICARVCNCKDHAVPHYAGFVRWCWDFDPSWLWPAGPRFDHPVRYLVYDDKADDCDCSILIPVP
jgi:hypothetical protein